MTGGVARPCIRRFFFAYVKSLVNVRAQLSQTILLASRRQDSSEKNYLLGFDPAKGVSVRARGMFTIAHIEFPKILGLTTINYTYTNSWVDLV